MYTSQNNLKCVVAVMGAQKLIGLNGCPVKCLGHSILMYIHPVISDKLETIQVSNRLYVA